MIIHTHILCYNEEDVLPYTLKHYGEFSDKIFVWDNYSTDESINIINSFPNTKIIPFGNPDGSSGMNAGTQTNLKISGWKKSNVPRDWIIFVDADEFICSPQKDRSVRDVLSDCKERGVNIPKTEGYDMYWDKEEKPTHDLPLFSQVVKGIPNWFFSKRAVFNPEVGPCCRVVGCHPGDSRHEKVHFTEPNPVTPETDPCLYKQKKAVCSVEPVLLLKHFRYLNHDHFYKRVACRKERLAQAREYSKEVRGWSKHYNRSTEELEKRYYSATKTYADKLVTFEF